MKKNFLFLCMMALLVTSCKDELATTPSPSKELTRDRATTESEYAISVDEALANLQAFMADEPVTKSSKARVVGSVTPVKYSPMVTKSSMDSVECDNLVYVANFEDEQGYAILAADKRIKAPIIAIADTGFLSDATIYTAMELAKEERIIVDGYPLTGPGFFTTPETGDELFINPNTVCLYDETANDTYVGNFSLDDIVGSDGDGNSLETLPADDYVCTGALATSHCLSFAINNLNGEIGDGCGRDHSVKTITETSDWRITKSVSPLLTLYVDWGQGKPFNDLYPEVEKIFGNKTGKAPAGCFPLAIAKIMAHFECPYTYEGYTINWLALKRSYSTTLGAQSAAYLLRGICIGCYSLCFYEGTFTFPTGATAFMRSNGLKNAHSYDYAFDKVTGMLDNGCPLIIYSIPGINIFKSHSWNIDGYKVKKRTVTTRTFVGGTLHSTDTKTETIEMVHCDFGWRGDCNGYYFSGVFKLNDPNIEYDPESYCENKTNYNNHLRVITYDKP